MKLFSVNIRNRNLIISFVAIGFLGTNFKASVAASIPSWFRILVYNDFTSKVRRNLSSVKFLDSLILLKKSTVSLLYGSASACGLR